MTQIKMITFAIGLLISWNIYLTLQLIETDRTQESVLQVNEGQTELIIGLRADMHLFPRMVDDRWTGSDAQKERQYILREMDHLHEDLKSHQHYHSDVIHEEKPKGM